MKADKIIFIFLLTTLLAIAGCGKQTSDGEVKSNEITCNAPYIKVGTSCCLDQNSNKICDSDEPTKPQEQKSTEIQPDEKESLTREAENLAKYMELEKFEEIYNMFTSERKSHKTAAEFKDLYPKIIYGVDEYPDINGSMIVKVRPKNIISVAVYDTEINGTEGIGYYKLIISVPKDEKTVPYNVQYKFKKEDGLWKFDDFDKVIYAGCFKTSECTSDKLKEACENTCQNTLGILSRRPWGLSLKNNTPFVCTINMCQCLCDKPDAKGFNEDYTGVSVIPDFEIKIANNKEIAVSFIKVSVVDKSFNLETSNLLKLSTERNISEILVAKPIVSVKIENKGVDYTSKVDYEVVFYVVNQKGISTKIIKKVKGFHMSEGAISNGLEKMEKKEFEIFGRDLSEEALSSVTNTANEWDVKIENISYTK